MKVLIALTIRLKLNFTQGTQHIIELGMYFDFRLLIFDAYFLVDVNITVFISDAYMIRNYNGILMIQSYIALISLNT